MNIKGLEFVFKKARDPEEILEAPPGEKKFIEIKKYKWLFVKYTAKKNISQQHPRFHS